MKKKGQAAMEFLMTYGWAILVVIAAIAVLAASGLLDFSRILPERCQFPAGMDCVDKPAISSSDDKVTVAVRNNVGWSIDILAINVTDEDGAELCSGTPEVNDNSIGSPLPRIEHENVFRVSRDTCGLTSNDVGNAFDATITITYNNTETGLVRSAVGDVRGRVG